MRAAVLEEFGSPLAVREVPDPLVGEGAALVEMTAGVVLPYTADVFSGARRYPLEPPVVPGLGGVGRVVAVGPDATRLRPGDLVWCDSTVRSRDDALTPDITLQGWSSRGDGGARLARHWHDGTYATLLRTPTENVFALPAAAGEDPARWAAGLAVHLIPFGGLRAGDLQAGETLLVNGATGNLGSSAVAVGLAMGAARVVAAGRDESLLVDLVDRFGDRVRPAVLTGADDAAVLIEAADGPVDMVIDLLPPEAPARSTRTAAMAVREYGRVVLMGGVGMLGGDDLALPYPWLMRNSVTVRGQWMYARAVIPALIGLVGSGQLDLRSETVTTFPLEQINEAVAHAAEHPRGFHRTVITMA